MLLLFLLYILTNFLFLFLFFVNEDGSKTGQGRRGYLQEGAWDAIHVIEVIHVGKISIFGGDIHAVTPLSPFTLI